MSAPTGNASDGNKLGSRVTNDTYKTYNSTQIQPGSYP